MTGIEQQEGKGDDSPAPQMVYEIRVRGRLDKKYGVQWFGGMAVAAEENGETVLTGPVVDRAALHGLLNRIRDLALTLISVNRITTPWNKEE